MSEPGNFEQQIREALSSIKEPGGSDLFQAGIIAGVQGEDGAITVTCRNPGWPDPIRGRIEREIQSSINARIPGLKKVLVQWQAGSAQPAGEPATPGSLAGGIRNVVAVGSGKGGVGKSTIAAALAYALKDRGHSVGLMDADVYGPSIPHMLGITEGPAVGENRYIPPQMDGIKVMSMGFLVPPEQAVVWRGPMLHKTIRDFIHAVEWGSLDYLIVDMPPGTGDVALSLSQQMPIAGGVIVCTPQDVALLDARKALNMFKTVKIPCRGIVENMSYFLCPDCGGRHEIFGHGGAQKWAAEAGVPFLGSVPINLQICVHGDAGAMRENFSPNSPVRPVLLEIADRLKSNIQSQALPPRPKLEVIA